MITITPTTFDQILPLRQHYVATLYGGLEGYAEDNARAGTPYAISDNDQVIGYACINDQYKQLWQFHLVRQAIPHGTAIFAQLIREGLMTSAVIATRDPVSIALCSEFQQRVWCQAYLFEDGWRTTAPLAGYTDVTLRLAQLSEAAHLAELCGDFLAAYEPYIAKQHLYVLEAGNEFLGIGLADPVLIHPPYNCIGMFVHPDHRQRGVGAYLIQQLKERTYALGYLPIAGCGHGNVASRKTLERGGMITRDRLIGFAFG